MPHNTSGFRNQILSCYFQVNCPLTGHPENRSLYYSSYEGEQTEAGVSLAALPDASHAKELGMSLCRVSSPTLVGVEHQVMQDQTVLGVAFKKQMFCCFLLVELVSIHMLGDLSVFLEMVKWSWVSGGISFFHTG